MTSFSKGTEPNFFLKSIDIEGLRMVLVLIPSVPRNETRISLIEFSFTVAIREIELLQVIDENVFRDVLDPCNVPADILRHNWVESLASRMGHDLFSSRSILGMDSSVMVALDPEIEKSLSCDHTVIGLLIVLELL